MSIDICELYKAIPLRHSFRAFQNQAISNDIRLGVRHFIETMEVPFEHSTKCILFTAEYGKKLYNNGINPPDNMAVFAQTDLVSVSKAGFVGQLIMLYAVSRSLTTCWFGHYKTSELGQYFDGIAAPNRIKESTLGYGYGNVTDVGERAICCMPMGAKVEHSKRLVDFVAGKNGASRKPLDKLLETGLRIEDIPEDIRQILEYAKLAPSAANSQMWRFGCKNGVITVAKPVGYKHFKWEHPDVDVGMCAAHIWLGLCCKGYKPLVEVEQNEDRAFWRFMY